MIEAQPKSKDNTINALASSLADSLALLAQCRGLPVSSAFENQFEMVTAQCQQVLRHAPPVPEHRPTGMLWMPVHTSFQFGQRVSKRNGSSWQGKIVGIYTTDLTPEGYAVESEREPGSVQIYPAKALRRVGGEA